MKRDLRLVVWAAVAVVCNHATAHHAPYIYDTEQERLITGRVVAFDWVQPHTWTTVAVTNSHGKEEFWALEGMTPAFLGRRGWNRYTLQPGDVIEVAFFPRKDGSPEGMFIRARLPDGSIKVMAVTESSRQR